jgi:tetratricopeptide (TPR) repeat protein
MRGNCGISNSYLPLQVELELALFEDAAEKFAKVLEYQVGGIPQPIAAYGQGIALLSIAQRDLQDGKVGSAFASIQKAIKGCIEFTSDFSCIYKLLGDLYSFGASVPPSVFKTPHEQTEGGVLDCIEKQLKFVSRGEGAYRSALKFHEATKGDDSYNITRASCLCDAACNILLQAKIISTRCKIDRIHSDADEMYEQAAKEFENAIDCNPLHAAAWCGLGCAVKDPLLAQRKLLLNLVFLGLHFSLHFFSIVSYVRCILSLPSD